MNYGKDILDYIKFSIEQNDKDLHNAIVNGLSEPDQKTDTSLTGYLVKSQIMTDAEKKAKADKLCQKVLTLLQSNDYAAALSELQKNLSKDGFAKLVGLGLFGNGFSRQLLEKFDTDDLIWSGIKSLYMIDVIETAKEKRPSALSDYNIDIFLVHRVTHEKTLIDFGTQYQAKALYLWFLLNPRKEYSREEIADNFDDIFEIYIALSSSRRDSDKADFDNFFKNARSKANDAVYKSLNDRDSAIWYEINLERKYSGGVFALSLKNEDIHLSEIIKKFR